MKNYPKFSGIGFFTMLCIFVCLFSCKENSKDVDAGKGLETTQTSEVVLPVKEATTVTVHVPSDPGGLSVYAKRTGYSTRVSEQFFPTLLHVDPVTVKVAPVVAKALPLVKEIESGEFAGMVRYTFEIQEAAVWDNGSPVTAADYEFIIKTCMLPDIRTAYKHYYKDIKSFKIDPDNPKKFSVVYKKHILGEEIVGGVYLYPEYVYDPDKIMRNYTITGLAAKMQDKDWAANGWKKEPGLKKMADDFNSPKFTTDKNFVSSCGAYKLESYEPNQKMVLSRKENWWGDKVREQYPMLTAIPEKLVYRFIPDMVTALTYLKSGEIDVMGSIEPQAFKSLKSSHADKFDFYSPSLTSYYYMAFHTTIPKLKDKRTRRALAHLFDLDRVRTTILDNLATRIIGPIHPSKPYYNKSLKLIDYNPEKAGALLKEAGWADSNKNGILDQTIDGELVELELNVLYGAGGPIGESFLILLKEAARKQGITINLVGKEFKAVMADVRSKKYEISIAAAQALPILDDLYIRWHSAAYGASGHNYSGFGTPESDKLIEDIRVTLDAEKRNKMYTRVQEILYDEQPAVFLYAPMERIAISKKFKHAVVSARKPGYFENYFATKQ